MNKIQKNKTITQKYNINNNKYIKHKHNKNITKYITQNTNIKIRMKRKIINDNKNQT